MFQFHFNCGDDIGFESFTLFFPKGINSKAKANVQSLSEKMFALKKISCIIVVKLHMLMLCVLTIANMP